MRTIREQWLGVAIGLVALFVAVGGPGAAVAAIEDLVTGKDIANRTITDRDIAKKTLRKLRGQAGPQGAPGAPGERGPAGDQGPVGPAGPAGSADTPAQVLGKVSTVDGAGSGLDADLVDGLQANAFVADADSAGGALSGTFSGLQIEPNAVGSSEISSVGLNDLESGGTVVLNSTDPPSIPADSCNIEGFLVGGSTVQPGKVALPSATAALPSGIFIQPAIIGFERELPVVYCNSSSSAINPPAPVTLLVRLIG